ncbi:hypothetical protein J2R96_001969 [Bradyrhizobium elkanii]|nr:hypothetical protein [Bradyrhizobium elkanii]
MDRQLMAQWMGKLGFELEIMADYIFSDVKKAERVFADESTLRRSLRAPDRQRRPTYGPMLEMTEPLAATIRRWRLIASKTAAPANARSGTSMVVAASCR